MKRILGLALLALTLGALPADAGDYTYADGYYWLNGTAYSRAEKWYKDYYYVQPYYAYGYCYPGYWAYTWKSYYAYSPVKLDYQAEDVEAQIIKLAAARDKAVLKIAEREQKSAAAAALVDKLGLAGNFNVPAYGAGLFPVRNYSNGYGSNYQLSSAGVQGNTVYGYSYSSVADVYGSTDLNALYQQAARLTENAQQLGGNANAGFQTLVGQASTAQSRTAEILAKGQAGAQVLKAAEAAPSARLEIRSTEIGAAKPLNPVPQRALTKPQAVEWHKLAGPQRCVECHTGEQAQGAFRIEAFDPATATPERWDHVLSYIVAPAGEQPKCPPGKPLSRAELMDFIRRVK